MYGELRLPEDEMTRAGHAGSEMSDMIARLDRLEEQANKLKVPVAYASMRYELRDHIELVGESLKKRVDKAVEEVVRRSA
jgi:hypothetical protein